MKKFNSNPLKSIKKTLNNTSSAITSTYDTVATQVSTNIADTIPKLTQDLQVMAYNVTGTEMPKNVRTELILPSKSEIKTNALIQNEKLPINQNMGNNILSAIDNKIKPLYKGCYSDDPINLTMQEYLGTVSNSIECIKLGKLNNLKYVGVQQGDKCYGSNVLPITEPVDKNIYCDVPCNNPNSGTCGGYYYNQVYTTDTINSIDPINSIDSINSMSESKKIISDELTKKNSFPNDLIDPESKQQKLTNHANFLNTVEKFTELNSDINKINSLLNKCVKKNSINSFILFVWITILLLLICVLIDYLHSRKKTK